MTGTIQNILAGMGTVLELFPSRSRIRAVSYLAQLRKNFTEAETGQPRDKLGEKKNQMTIEEAIKNDWNKIGQGFHRVIKREKNNAEKHEALS